MKPQRCRSVLVAIFSLAVLSLRLISTGLAQPAPVDPRAEAAAETGRYLGLFQAEVAKFAGPEAGRDQHLAMLELARIFSRTSQSGLVDSLAQRVEDPFYKAQFLSVAAVTHLNGGDLAGARDLLPKIREASPRGEVIARLALLAEQPRRNPTGVLAEIAKLTSDKDTSDKALATVFLSWLALDRTEDATRALQAIKNDYTASELLLNLVSQHCHYRRFAPAQAVSKNPRLNLLHQAQPREALIAAALEAGQLDVADTALAELRSARLADPAVGFDLQLRLFMALKKSGASDEAGKLLPALQQGANAGEQARLASARQRLGEQDQARIFDQAAASVEKISDAYLRDQALAALAQAQIDAGRSKAGIATIQSIADPGFRTTKAEQFALQFGRAGRLADAQAMLGAIPDPNLRERVLGDLAVAQARRGNASDALRLLHELKNEAPRAGAIGEIAAVLLSTDARPAFDLVLQEARSPRELVAVYLAKMRGLVDGLSFVGIDLPEDQRAQAIAAWTPPPLREIPLPPRPAPVRVSPATAQFPGFEKQADCASASALFAAAPWADAPALASAATPPPAKQAAYDPVAYRFAVSRAMELMRVLYEGLNEQQSAVFEKLWAPYFDFPSTAAFDYFTRLNPVLAAFLQARSDILNLGDAAQESWTDASICAALGDEAGTRAALTIGRAQAGRLRSAREALLASMSQLRALGVPPNPIEQRCAARRQHKSAVQALSPGGDFNGEYQGAWQSVESTTLPPETNKDLKFGTLLAVLRTNYGNLGTVSQFSGSFCYSTLGDDSQGRVLVQLSKPKEERGAPSPLAVSPGTFFDYALVRYPPLTRTQDGAYVVEWRRSPDAPFKERLEFRFTKDGMTADLLCALDQDYAIRTIDYAATYERDRADPSMKSKEAVYKTVLSLPAGTVLLASRWTGKLVGPVKDAPKSEAPVIVVTPPSPGPWLRDGKVAAAGNPVAEQAAPTSKPAAADLEAKAREEGVARQRELISQIEKTSAAIQAELSTEKNVDRAKALREQLLQQKANLSAEKDALLSLETGVIVHTRSEWDLQAHDQLVSQMREEVDGLAEEDRRIRSLSRLTSLIKGYEGLEAQRLMQSELAEAVKAPDRLDALRRLSGKIQGALEDQAGREFAAAKEAEAVAENRLFWAESIKTAADYGLMASSLFATGGASAVMVGYGAGTGYAEGGPLKAVENAARAYSDKVDLVLTAYDGWTSVDENNQQQGFTGALSATAQAYLVNKVMETASAGAQSVMATAPWTPSKPAPRFDAFRSPKERYTAERHAARTPEQQAQVERRYEIVVQRERLEAEISAATAKHEAAIPANARKPDGTVDAKNPDYLKARDAWQQELGEIRRRNNTGYEKRMAEHKAALAESGVPADAVKLSGSEPKSILSDIDMTAATVEHGRKFTEVMKARGHPVLEYPDRWIITDTDTTLWKPGCADIVGSSALEAGVQLSTESGSDKFATPGGKEFTGVEGIKDPEGAVLDNLKKAAEAGLGDSSRSDLHVIGKSVSKVVDVVRTNARGETRPAFDEAHLKKADAVRSHATAEEAGITTFGNPAAQKDAELRRFLELSRTVMTRAYSSASEASAQLRSHRLQELKQAVQSGQRDRELELRRQLVILRSANAASVRGISVLDPKLSAQVLSLQLAAAKPGPQEKKPQARGYNWLFERQPDGAKKIPATPTLAALAKRMGTLATRLDKDVLPSLKKNSAEAAHFTSLKLVLAKAGEDPRRALGEVEALTGYPFEYLERELSR